MQHNSSNKAMSQRPHGASLCVARERNDASSVQDEANSLDDMLQAVIKNKLSVRRSSR